jgi:hypothetical protein
LPLADIPWPPLKHKPHKEHYSVLKPIPMFQIPDDI